MNLPDHSMAKDYYISPEGLQQLLINTQQPKLPAQDLLWTTDIRKELPIKLAKTGIAAERPTTLI
jgi:hypothetical protein